MQSIRFSNLVVKCEGTLKTRVERLKVCSDRIIEVEKEIIYASTGR